MTQHPPRIIVALDFPGAAPALALAARLDPTRCRLKVGKDLFTRAGPAVAERLREQGFEVFLDLKFHDIPNTVGAACAAAAEKEHRKRKRVRRPPRSRRAGCFVAGRAGARA